MPSGVIKFGDFALDCDRFELHRAGQPIKLEKLPMELLILLVEKGGHLVTRQEIVDRLWGQGVFLDTEHGINTAVRKIRNALRDNPEQSRFVQTVTGKGYRFIAQTSTLSSGPNGNGSAAITPGATALAESSVPPSQADSVMERMGCSRSSRRAIQTAAFGAVIAVGTAAVLFGLNLGGVRDRGVARTQHPRIQSLAVLPLDNLSGDPAQDFFADGMTDELITTLAKNSALRVISRTSAMQYKKANKRLPDIAHELGVDAILEGSIERSGGRVHVNVQLVHAPSDTHLWAESYDRDESDVGVLQNELATTIARQVGLTVGPLGTSRSHISGQAHDQYLLGRYHWFAGDYKKSRQYFQQAINLQPDYAAAWAGIADSYVASAVAGESSPPSAMPLGEQAARKAVALDDSSADAHLSLAAVNFFYRWDWAGAEREAARALQLNPGFAEGHHLRGNILQVLGRTDEALQEQKKSMELDPFARPAAMVLALIHAREFDAALNEARLRSEAQPDNAEVREMLGVSYWHKGMEAEAARELEASLQLAGKKERALAFHQAYERGAFRGLLEWYLSDFRKQAAAGEYVSPLEYSDIYACLKRKDEALFYLEKAYEERTPWLVHVPDSVDFDFLHSDPRYQTIMKKMGLPAT